MKLQIKYDIHKACSVILSEHLDRLGIPYQINGLGELFFQGSLSPRQYDKLINSLGRYGIEIIYDQKSAIVQQIRHLITELVYMNEKLPDSRISSYISRKMNLSYSYLSRVFSAATHCPVENFLILQRIERVKQLMINENLTLTEVAWKMNYSSVAHLSNQFKKTTGLTPTLFQRIIQRRRSSYPATVI